MTDASWQSFITAFHGEKPGVTEQVLSRVDGSPYAWLAEPLQDTTGWIAEVACGSAPTREHFAEHRWVGLDISTGELAVAAAAGRRPLVRARADALPFGGGSVDAVVAAMALQVVTPLPDVLAEIVRVLRPGGLFVALVPAGLGFRPRGWLGWARVLRALGATGLSWPNPDACDGVAGVLARHGFGVLSSERRVFPFPIDTDESATLLIDSLYLPGTSPARITTAKRALSSRSRPGRSLPMPLRRVIARH